MHPNPADALLVGLLALLLSFTLIYWGVLK